jgi:hypothetical protein
MDRADQVTDKRRQVHRILQIAEIEQSPERIAFSFGIA